MKRLALVVLAPALAVAAPPLGYQMPPKRIADLMDARPQPGALLSPDRKKLLIVERPALPPIADLARPELRLAGLRLDPRTNGPSHPPTADRITIHDVASGTETPVAGLPPRMMRATWSPDGTHFAFESIDASSTSLWVGDVASAQVKKLADNLNAASGPACLWSGPSALVCRRVPDGRGAAPVAGEVPAGPVIQENLGKKTPNRTFPDVLKGPTDEALLDHYLASQIVRVELDGRATPVGAPSTYLGARPSPSGEYLLVTTLRHPYSLSLLINSFPIRSEIWDAAGKVAKTLADLPLADAVPVDFDAVRTGPRDLDWRADAPAEACWLEARDGGDPKAKADVRDELLCQTPKAAKPRSLAKLALRGGEVTWGDGHLALVAEGWWKTRRQKIWAIAPDGDAKPRVLFDRSSEDRYTDPGQPATRVTSQGTEVLAMVDGGKSLVYFGEGASPDGDFPFVDKLDLESGKSQRLWRCAAPSYERAVRLLDDGGQTLLTYAETPTEPPNFFARALPGASRTQLTHFANPSPELAKIGKQLIRYQRPDGVQLSGTLYLPPGYDPKRDGRLPVLLWVYPSEFKSAAAASQVQSSPYHFSRVLWFSPLFALFDGFAVLDNPTMPIVGEGQTEPNDSYVEQLSANAKAAVDELVRLGIGDRERMAVGGHSYGAFTTANLLAHTDLFRAGIAESGAYNRTLTPFGFQAEERTFWQAPEVYMKMSPFAHAGDIDEPLLLIHGQADDNPGTFTVQSERLYEAMKGLGATVRLVLLPLEKHGYQGRESIMHLQWERVSWLDKYVKSAKPRPPKKQS